MMKKSKGIFCFILASVLIFGTIGCGSGTSGLVPTKELADISQGKRFVYNAVPVNLNPVLKDYKASKDLGNITNKDKFDFSDEAKNKLAANGFLVVPNYYQEFFSIYEMNRYDYIPNFVTTDAMMHNYHLYFSHLLRTLEKDKLRDELVKLTDSMLYGSREQYEALKGTAWENAAKRNVAFFAVAARLLGSGDVVPDYVGKEVEAELKLINGHNEIFYDSPIMNMGSTGSITDMLKEDYTQYIPRGHYTKSDELKSYFKAMMWYGRMTFRTANEDETKSAALMSILLSGKESYESWNRIYEPTNFFVGKSDDLGLHQYNPLLKDIYGGIPQAKTLTEDANKWNDFNDRVKKMDTPMLNSIPIFDETIQPDRDSAIKGFRFMGQRFTLDASVFQRLIYREVKENGEGQRRMLPSGLDVPSAMGSEEAYAILDEMGETDYKDYPENMKKLQNHIKGIGKADWTQNLYWSWLYTLAPLTESKGTGYPSFMQNKAWTRKQLETYMGSFTELKHDTILYAKQVYAEMGGGGEEEDDRGYVEPNPHVYARLAALADMTAEGLKQSDLLSEETYESLIKMKDLAIMLKEISEKELADIPLDDAEYSLIQSFGGQLEHFWLEALSDLGVDSPSSVFENPAALVADIATDPSGTVLEVGSGYISTIYAIVPIDGKLRIAKGGVYTYYEFPWPADDRLTDERWKGMLEDGTMPDQPAWTKLYRTEDLW